ncbi:MAG: flavin reductase family protein [Mangrovicoccus sp.]
MTEIFTPGPDHSRALRSAFGRFATGVTVVTAPGPDGPVGMTANSFSSVSLDPAMALWCIGKASDRFHVFGTAPRFAIHILAEDQIEISNGFAKSSAYFDSCAWAPGADEVPAIEGCLARFDCRLNTAHDAGDHVILVGDVLEVTLREGAPLLFAGGAYGRAEAL